MIIIITIAKIKIKNSRKSFNFINIKKKKMIEIISILIKMIIIEKKRKKNRINALN